MSDYILFDKLALPIIESFIKIGFNESSKETYAIDEYLAIHTYAQV